MFIGIYFREKGKSDAEIASICFTYAEKFTQEFGSLKCYDLRPNGFTEQDPPHACENLTVQVNFFTYHFINTIVESILCDT